MCPFFFQLPVSVYESVIDIINGEVLFILNIILFTYSFLHNDQIPLRKIILPDVFRFLIQATMLFAELTYTLATEEAERIGVDHVARMTATGTGENSTGKLLILFEGKR